MGVAGWAATPGPGDDVGRWCPGLGERNAGAHFQRPSRRRSTARPTVRTSPGRGPARAASCPPRCDANGAVGVTVPQPRPNVDEILATLREMERLTENGTSVSTAAKKLGITDQTYYRWRMRYGSLSEDEEKRLSELDEERARLRRVIEEQAQDVAMLQDLTQGEIPSAARRRLAVAYLVDHYGISERRARHVVGQDPSTQSYDLTGGEEDGPVDGWGETDADLDDELAWPGPEAGLGAGLGVGAGARIGARREGAGAVRGSGATAPGRGAGGGGFGGAPARPGTGHCAGRRGGAAHQDPVAGRPDTGPPPGADQRPSRPRLAGAALGNGATGGVGRGVGPPPACCDRSLPIGPVLRRTSGRSFGLRAWADTVGGGNRGGGCAGPPMSGPSCPIAVDRAFVGPFRKTHRPWRRRGLVHSGWDTMARRSNSNRHLVRTTVTSFARRDDALSCPDGTASDEAAQRSGPGKAGRWIEDRSAAPSGPTRWPDARQLRPLPLRWVLVGATGARGRAGRPQT